MNALVLDTGALIAIDHNDRATWALLRVAEDDGDLVLVPTGAIAQAWRNGQRQARLARALRHCSEVVLDGEGARAAGELCGRARTNDVVDASVAIAAATVAPRVPTTVFTSDPDDLRDLISELDVSVLIEPV